jgi:AraC family transcriptional regulator of adaptative response/methylated-DNA-[protein]-cysteine methyltransferase
MEHDPNYLRVAEAIAYLHQNFRSQPTLDEVAEQICLSPFHFQRLFTEWAGVSPKKFLRYISLQHARRLLENPSATLFDVAHETGLSGPSRLHDLFISIEGMTPGEYKNGGEHLAINYCFAESLFGMVLIASTPKGICYLGFADDQRLTLGELHRRFPRACYQQRTDDLQQDALSVFTRNWDCLPQIKLHLRGTDFQLRVWEALLKTPAGRLTTYGTVAHRINQARASRAVGSAVGSNLVAFLIPCHRVIRSSGAIGQYHWGSVRKAAIIGWEGARTE